MPLRDKVQHVIVLMLENRSFDHLLGFVPGVGELTGAESNPFEGADVAVSDAASHVLEVDPDHSHDAVQQQLFHGVAPGGEPLNRGFVESFAARVASTGKAVDPRAIMRCFPTARVPVLARLAQEFVTCRRWFASAPGETWPNRNYAHAATSHGQVDIKLDFYTDRTIFELLAQQGRSWRIYHDGPAQTWAFPRLWIQPWRHRFKKVDRLFKAIDKDELDHYSFVEPDHGLTPWDRTSSNQHPSNNTDPRRKGADFLAAEKLIADVYEALRARPAVFLKTLLVVTYDEHGGFFDHVPPRPTTPPGDHVWHEGQADEFRFDRLGVRVPTLLISPWLAPGVDDRVFDHSSVVMSLRQLFAPGSLPLTRRDAEANGFHDLPTLAHARDPLPVVHPAEARGLVERMVLKEMAAEEAVAPQALDAFQESLVGLTEEVDRKLSEEAAGGPPAEPAALWAAQPRVQGRFRTGRELGAYLEYVTQRLHAAVDERALDLVDSHGRLVEQPDAGRIDAAFAEAALTPGPRGHASLQNGHGLVARIEADGLVRRIDLETGAEEVVTAPAAHAPAGGGVVAAAAPASPARLALRALGRADLAP